MGQTGIYLQIPFCESKCSFCNFSSRVEKSDVFAAYCHSVRREIESLAADYSRLGVENSILTAPVDTVYFGGGTPAIVGAENLEKIVAVLRERFQFSNKVEFTLETTPGSADSAFLAHAREMGINRLSIGAQSFCDPELKAVGRLHSAQDTCALVRSARASGFFNISVDLIAGLPHQTYASWRKSLETLAALRPEHVSIYIFEIDEKSRLGGEVLKHGTRYHADAVPGEAFMADGYEMAREMLAGAGYLQYEISNFALPGFESRHNRKYWQLDPYIGLGAGAHSFDGLHRWFNAISHEEYSQRLFRAESPVMDFHELSAQEQIEEYFFLGLRQCKGIGLETARRRWGREVVGNWDHIIANLVREGRLQLQDDWILMPEREYLVSNEIFQEFLVA